MFQLDQDRDGFLNIHELKLMIRNHQCDNIPENLAHHILRMHDEDSNGKLDFDEFYRMSLQQEWLISRLMKRYCKLIVPSPHRPEEDEIGKINFLFIFLSFNLEENKQLLLLRHF